MLTLPNILPAANAAAPATFDDNEPTGSASPQDTGDTQFDDLMSRAMSPQMQPAQPDSAQKNPLHVVKDNEPSDTQMADDASLMQTQPGQLGHSGKTEKPGTLHHGRKHLDKAGAKSKDNSTTPQPDANTAVEIDNSQNLPIQLLAPALSAFLLGAANGNPSTKTLNFADKKNAVTALPIGTDAKSVATGKVMMAGKTALKETASKSELALKLDDLKLDSSVNPDAIGAKTEVAPNQIGAKEAASKSELASELDDLKLDSLVNPTAIGAKAETALNQAGAKSDLPTKPDTTSIKTDGDLKPASHNLDFPAEPGKIQAALKDLGLQPDKVQAATAMPDKIAEANLNPAKTAAPAVNDEILKNAGVSTNIEPATSSKPHGTLAAKQDVPMQKTENTIKVAGQNEKVLPGNMISSARGNNLSARALSVAPANTHTTESGSNIIPISSISERNTNTTSALDSIPVSNLAEIRTRALDRTHDMMSLQAVRMVDSKMDSLSVVIKPGAGMQLSLQLKQNSDGIQAQATLQHGDFTDLNQHWPELQQRLEQRGIKLAPLTSDESAMTFTSQSGSQQSGSSQRKKKRCRPVHLRNFHWRARWQNHPRTGDGGPGARWLGILGLNKIELKL